MSDAFLSSLLASGGDGQLLRSEDGLNRSGCRFEPEPGLLGLGSCAASTVSGLGFRAARERHDVIVRGHETVDAAHRDNRRRLVRSVVPGARIAPDVVLIPSGTHADYIPLLLALADEAPVTHVVMAPADVGFGTMVTSEFRHFAARTPTGAVVPSDDPLGCRLTGCVEATCVAVRDAGGAPLDPDENDRRARRTVDGAIGAGHPLLHVVAHSKTGVHAPSLVCVRRATAEHGSRLHVVVDAAQGWISRRGFADAIGALLVPDGYRNRAASLPFPDALGATARRGRRPTGGIDGVRTLRSAATWVSCSAGAQRSPRSRAMTNTTTGSAPECCSPSRTGPMPGSATAKVSCSRTPPRRSSTGPRHGCSSRTGHRCRSHWQIAVVDGSASMDSGGLRRAEIGRPMTVAPDGRAELRIALGAPVLCRYAAGALDDPSSMIADDLDLTTRRLRDLAR